MLIFVFFQIGTKISKRFYGVTTQNITKFAHDVATFSPLLSYPSMFQYSSPFRNGSAKLKIALRKTLIFRLLVAMATSLKWLPNECKNYQFLAVPTLKIRPVVFENSLLLCRPLKIEKVRTQKTSAKYIARRAGITGGQNHGCSRSISHCQRTCTSFWQ